MIYLSSYDKQNSKAYNNIIFGCSVHEPNKSSSFIIIIFLIKIFCRGKPHKSWEVQGRKKPSINQAIYYGDCDDLIHSFSRKPCLKAVKGF